MRKMRTLGIAALAAGAMLALPTAGFAASAATPGQTATAPKALKGAKGTKAATAHSVRGVVKSMDANTLVVERGTGKNKKEMTFALDSSTHRTGDINVGSTVAVRYTGDAAKMTATNIQPVKTKARARKAAASATH